jgi:hypothetical protein
VVLARRGYLQAALPPAMAQGIAQHLGLNVGRYDFGASRVSPERGVTYSISAGGDYPWVVVTSQSLGASGTFEGLALTPNPPEDASIGDIQVSGSYVCP